MSSAAAEMRKLFGSLLFRIAALFLLGLAALQVTILVATMWPDGRPMMFRLVEPRDAREIAYAIERVPADLRPAIAAAASNGAVTVELLPGFPDEADEKSGTRPVPRLEARFRHYADELEGRPLRVQAREGTIFSRPASPDEPPRGPIRLLVGLETGEVVSIERAPLALQLLANRYLMVALVAAAVLLAILLSLLWQVVRPVARLAAATEAFRANAFVLDVPPTGAREVQALADAFNAMKQRIGGLVDERTRMLAAIAHDLRTYLTRLRLRADHIADDRQRARAISDVEDMARLLDDILLFARSDAGAEPDAQVIDARAEAIAYIEMRQEAGDDVALATGPAVLPCRCAPLAFRRILSNLVDNALRYGERARVTLRAEDDLILLVVIDNGPGVPNEVIARLTEPFERLEPSRGRHSGGAGLGLSIVKALAETHGGCLELENRTVGGLRAKVLLPSATGNCLNVGLDAPLPT